MRSQWIATLTIAAACAGGGAGRRPLASDTWLAAVDDAAAFRGAAHVVALDRETSSRERGGNAVKLLVNGVAAFARRFENARGADLVLVKTFIFTDDEVGRRVAALLIERAKAGARVVLQYDVKGSIGGLADAQQMLANATARRPVGEKDIIGRMRAAGVVIVPTNSPSRTVELEEWARNVERLQRDPTAAVERSFESLILLDHCDHEKYWITGRRTAQGRLELVAILGGMNIASEYAYGGTRRIDSATRRGGWRDTDVEVRGPVVNAIVDRFFDATDYHMGQDRDPVERRRWNPPQSPQGTARVRFIYNHPLVESRRSIERLYRLLIDATPRGGSVRIQTAYFAPSRDLRRAFRRALRRGIKLTVVSNSESSNDIGAVAQAGRFAFYMLLRESGIVALFERRPRPDLGELTLHSKVASFGTRGPVVIGSANLDAQSLHHNSESVVVIEDPVFRRQFDAMFERDLADGRALRLTREVYERQPTFRRFLQAALYYGAWYWL